MDPVVTHPNKTPGRVLVFGASGYIGTHLVERLLQLPYPLRASARNSAVLEGRNWEGVELVQADALKPETLVVALRDVDVAYYLVQVPYLEQTAGNCYDVGGPEVLTYEAIMRQYGEVVGKHPIIIPVPVLSPRLSSYWLRLVTSVPTPVARALIEGLKQDVIANDTAIRALVPLRLLSFRESVESTLAIEARQQVVARWVEGSIVCRNYHPEYSFYAKRAGDSAISTAPAEHIWQQITSIGDTQGYYYLDSLWKIRGMIDWMLGGPSFRRRRRHRTNLRVGDVIDAWRVIAIEPGSRLTLLMEMKAPGAGVLEFELKPEGHVQRVSATAYFHPAGLWGLLYWYLMAPFHWLLFRGLTRAIAARASAASETG